MAWSWAQLTGGFVRPDYERASALVTKELTAQLVEHRTFALAILVSEADWDEVSDGDAIF